MNFFGIIKFSRSVVTSLMKRSSSSSPSGSKHTLNRLLMDMPVDKNDPKATKNQRLQKHISDAQKQRQKIKERGSKYVPGTVNLQVLSNGSPGSPACVYVFTDQNRYLFNCGEGTQRLANEHKTKIARLDHIFMTQTKWKHIGGLPGLSLTVQDAGVPELTLHGPPGLGGFFNAMKRFVILRNLKVIAETTEEGSRFEDDVLSVQYVPLTKTNDHPDGLSSKDVLVASDGEDYYENENLKRNQGPARRNSQSEDDFFFEQYAESVTAYICKLKPKPGVLCLEKCVERGVPPGPLLGQLKNGHDVTLPNGQVVKASDVKGPDDPGPVFIFLDIPDEQFLTLLWENAHKFQPYQSQASTDSDAAMVVLHFSPDRIVRLAKYQEFIEQFSPSTQHMYLNDRNHFSGYLSAHRIQWKLNQINETMFPLLGEVQHQTNPESVLPMTTFHLRPRKKIDCSSSVSLNPQEFLSEVSLIEGFAEDVDRLKKELTKGLVKETVEESYPKLVFLGTGSCIPNKTRNVSSILVYTHPDSCLLLDCGEGTYGQIVRFYGKEKARKVIRDLKGIFISHLHADHHIGLIGLLRGRMREEAAANSGKLPPITLFAPEQIQSYLKFYHIRIEPIKHTFKLVRNLQLSHDPENVQQHSYDCCGLLDITTCLVPHCKHAFAVAVTLNNAEQTKITYSGDCLPSTALVELGRDSHILIHEATMEDELEDEAALKMHSTVSQAIRQGELMKAKYTILTHFSQRYAKLPRMDYDPEKRVGIAFDNMMVTMPELEKVNLLYPTLKLLFSEDCEEMEQKAIKRMNKRLRLNDEN